jgi:ribosomal protein S1
MENNHFLKMLRSSSPELQGFKGRIVQGACYDFDQKRGTVHLDLGNKMSAYFPTRLLVEEFGCSSFAHWVVGDTISFYANQMETPSGDIVINAKKNYTEKYTPDETWAILTKLYKKEHFGLGLILNRVKGGLSVSMLGFVAFLPNTQLLKGKSPTKAQLDERLKPFMGAGIYFKIIRMTEEPKRNIVVSRVAVLRSKIFRRNKAFYTSHEHLPLKYKVGL